MGYFAETYAKEIAEELEARRVAESIEPRMDAIRQSLGVISAKALTIITASVERGGGLRPPAGQEEGAISSWLIALERVEGDDPFLIAGYVELTPSVQPKKFTRPEGSVMGVRTAIGAAFTTCIAGFDKREQKRQRWAGPKGGPESVEMATADGTTHHLQEFSRTDHNTALTMRWLDSQVGVDADAYKLPSQADVEHYERNTRRTIDQIERIAAALDDLTLNPPRQR